jgi:hypothetical protein
MCERSLHNSRPQRFGSFVLVEPVVPSVHTPYCYSCLSSLKINVIGNPYDLWRRPS